jgi:hypothetical protein
VRLRLAILGAVLLLACEPTEEAAQSSVPASPKPIAAVAAGCPNAGPPVSNAYQPPAIANTTASFVRTCDRAGGWSLELPPGWFERLSAQHGRELFSYDPNGMLNNGGNNPPADGVFIRLQMMQNPERLDTAAFAVWPLIAQTPNARDHRQIVLAGQSAEFYAVPSYWSPSETDLVWFVKSPFFDDRMVVVRVVRAESPLRAEAERVVTSLRFFEPAPINLTPTMSRAEAIARVASRSGLSLTRIEAKLILRKELGAPSRFGYDFYTDPDALTWVVAYAGTGIQPFRVGVFVDRGPTAPTPAPTLGPCLSTVEVFPADGMMGSTHGGSCDLQSWPSWFDTLVDRGS